MSKNIVIIGENAFFGQCAYCGKEDELRPYGKEGAKICYDCGMLPQNRQLTDENIEKFLDGEDEN